MSDSEEKEEILKRLLDLQFKKRKGPIPASHRAGTCDAELVTRYVSGGMEDAARVIAEEKIFECSNCSRLAIELLMNAREEDKSATGQVLDTSGYEDWKKWFAERNSYIITKTYGKTELRFEFVKGWRVRIFNARKDFTIKIGEKTYSPTAEQLLEGPDSPEGVLESSDGPAVNIREFAGLRK